MAQATPPAAAADDPPEGTLAGVLVPGGAVTALILGAAILHTLGPFGLLGGAGLGVAGLAGHRSRRNRRSTRGGLFERRRPVRSWGPAAGGSAPSPRGTRAPSRRSAGSSAGGWPAARRGAAGPATPRTATGGRVAAGRTATGAPKPRAITPPTPARAPRHNRPAPRHSGPSTRHARNAARRAATPRTPATPRMPRSNAAPKAPATQRTPQGATKTTPRTAATKAGTRTGATKAGSAAARRMKRRSRLTCPQCWTSTAARVARRTPAAARAVRQRAGNTRRNLGNVARFYGITPGGRARNTGRNRPKPVPARTPKVRMTKKKPPTAPRPGRVKAPKSRVTVRAALRRAHRRAAPRIAGGAIRWMRYARRVQHRLLATRLAHIGPNWWPVIARGMGKALGPALAFGRWVSARRRIATWLRNWAPTAVAVAGVKAGTAPAHARVVPPPLATTAPRPVSAPTPHRPVTPPGAVAMSDPNVEGAIEAVQTAFANVAADPADSMVGYEGILLALPKLLEAVGEGLTQFSQVSEDEFAVDSNVPSMFVDAAKYAHDLSGFLEEAHEHYRALHEKQIENYEEPRPGAEKWDVRANQQ
jgi:hypothetical protein